ncbi:MAG: tetratricopeptide repeat protein [Bacteroidales bacterium]|nr:tetratricopeptide repeat protein [Bacteroidales bacterium]
MKRTFLFIAIALLALSTFAQDTKHLKVIDVNTALDLTRKGMNLVRHEKYDEALSTFNSIPYGNSLWDNAQYEKAYIYELQEQYSTALQLLEDLLNDPSCSVSKSNILTEIGNCYDDMGNYDKAAEAYSKALQVSPYNYNLHFNKGVSLLRQGNYEEALECFKQSLFLAPGHKGSHLQYGVCCLLLGYTVPGIMALNYSILLGDDSYKTLLALQHLNTLYTQGIQAYNEANDVKISNEYKEKNLFYKEIMDEIDLYCRTSKTPKAPTKVTHPVASFNYLVLSNVKARPNSLAIEDQLYATAFQQITANKQYDLLALYQFMGTDVDNGKVTKLAEKKSNDINKFLTNQGDLLDEIITKGLFRTPSDTAYIYKDFTLTHWGVLHADASGKKIQDGRWYFINQDGQLEGCRDFRNGTPNGQEIYYTNNNIDQSYNIKNGKPDGKAYMYSYCPLSSEQKLNVEGTLSDGVLHGPLSRYNKSGQLEYEATYSYGKLEGETRAYYSNGQIKAVEHYKDDEPNGTFTQYYPNGQIETTYNVGAKDEVFSITSYSCTGKTTREGQIRNNELYGKNIYKYPNGTISSIDNYNEKGMLEGESTTYFRNGNPDQKIIYNNGDVVGIQTYSTSGLLRFRTISKNGNIVSAESLNPDNTVKETYLPKNKLITYNTYRDNGTLCATQTIDVNGKIQGTSKTYYPNGQVKDERNFKDNQLDGTVKSYSPSGNLILHSNYTDGKRNGLFVTYFDTKEPIVSAETFCRNDTITGALYNYHQNGSIQEMICYDDNGQIVSYHSYLPDGKKNRTIRFYDGMPLIYDIYDFNETIVQSDTLCFGNGKQHIELSKRNSRIVEILNGDANSIGIATLQTNEGTIADTTHYLCKEVWGSTTHRFPTGEKYSVRNWLHDQQNGTSRLFDPSGKLHASIDYEMDKLQGAYCTHYSNGKTFIKFNYLQDELEGISYIYAPDGKTVLAELYYTEGALFKCAFLQKNGKMSEPQDVNNESKTIQAYYPTGKLALVLNIKDYDVNGEVVSYYNNGHAAISVNYLFHKLNGDYISYYENGKTYKKTSYVLDELNGSYELFYDNGQPMYVGAYYYDTENGLFKSLDKNGNVLNQADIYYGKFKDE